MAYDVEYSVRNDDGSMAYSTMRVQQGSPFGARMAVIWQLENEGVQVANTLSVRKVNCACGASRCGQ